MRISIYIDGANFFYGVKIINKRYSDMGFDFEKFINDEIIKENNELINIYYYNAPLKQLKEQQKLYVLQQKFFSRMRKIPKLKLILCRRQKRVDNYGKEYHIIKGDDIHLAIDMLYDALKNKYDKAILLSGDGDFAPVINYVKREGKYVINYYFEGNLSKALFKECEKSIIIDKKIVNKFFYRIKK